MDSTNVSLAILDSSSIWTHWFITGLITSVFASIFFYLFLWTLKPDLSISPVIAHHALNTRDGVVKVYAFKVINRALFHRVIDVQCQLLLLEDVNTEGGTNVFIQSLTLRNDKLWYIKRKFLSENGSFASVFFTVEDLQEIWDSDRKRIQFQVNCKHALSGFSKVFACTYYTKESCIKIGKFKFGDSFRIS